MYSLLLSLIPSRNTIFSPSWWVVSNTFLEPSPVSSKTVLAVVASPTIVTMSLSNDPTVSWIVLPVPIELNSDGASFTPLTNTSLFVTPVPIPAKLVTPMPVTDVVTPVIAYEAYLKISTTSFA